MCSRRKFARNSSATNGFLYNDAIRRQSRKIQSEKLRTSTRQAALSRVRARRDLSYETIRRWCDKFGVGFAHRIKANRRRLGATWHLDEIFVTLRGEPHSLWRAVDEQGTEIDILLQNLRDKAAAKRFFQRVLRSCSAPNKIVTDQLRSYPAAKADVPELVNAEHIFVKAAARVNNRARTVISLHANVSAACEASGFRLPERTQAFLGINFT